MPQTQKRRIKGRRAGVPPASSNSAKRRMQAARRRDTAPEVRLRSILHSMGLRYRVDRSPIENLQRRADIVFGTARVAVFVDGCFWHGCPLHGTWPKENANFWRDKIETNRRRDADTERHLTEKGWMVIRIWEHDDPQAAACTIAEVVRGRRSRRSD